MITIRPAQPEDLTALLDLYDRLYEILIGEYGYPFTFSRPENEALLQVQLKSKFCCIFLAMRDGVAVGFVHGSVSKLDRRLHYREQKSIARIDHIYVCDELRGSGAAALLLDAAEAWFREAEVTVVESYVLHQNKQSLVFHQKHGYEQVALRLLKGL